MVVGPGMEGEGRGSAGTREGLLYTEVVRRERQGEKLCAGKGVGVGVGVGVVGGVGALSTQGSFH